MREFLPVLGGGCTTCHRSCHPTGASVSRTDARSASDDHYWRPFPRASTKRDFTRRPVSAASSAKCDLDPELRIHQVVSLRTLLQRILSRPRLWLWARRIVVRGPLLHPAGCFRLRL